MKKLRTTLIASGIGAAGVAAALILAPTASAHGWVTDPPSRQANCASGATSFACGSIQYEPQSVEGPQGLTQCSGGNSGYAILDDNSKPWPHKKVGSTVTIQWNLTANHATRSWEYFVDGVLFRTFEDGGAKPAKDISHTLTNLPQGDHTILARWNVADTAPSTAFYNCIDITVGEGGVAPTPTPTPTSRRSRPTRRTRARRPARTHGRRRRSTSTVTSSPTRARPTRPSGGRRARSLVPPSGAPGSSRADARS